MVILPEIPTGMILRTTFYVLPPWLNKQTGFSLTISQNPNNVETTGIPTLWAQTNGGQMVSSHPVGFFNLRG